jgi:hypothetical protein
VTKEGEFQFDLSVSVYLHEFHIQRNTFSKVKTQYIYICAQFYEDDWCHGKDGRDLP